MKLEITLISDTHGKHRLLHNDLSGGDLLIHAGDFMNGGYDIQEATDFLEWFDKIDNYENKIFIAGNHDRVFENTPQWVENNLPNYPTIDYLQDNSWVEYADGHNGEFPQDTVRVYGTPWQPEFHNWAFNLPRNGEALQNWWDAIPDNTDILITHGPPFGHLDIPGGQNIRVGCEMLRHRVDTIQPKIHVFGHIHGGWGHYFDGHTHFFNASVLDESYRYTQQPWTFDWNHITNEITWLKFKL